MRDDFPVRIKDTLARRVGFICSNPKCGMLTVGPNVQAAKATNIGVAAHITAAAKGGPRFDANLTQEQRSAIDNAIWLCQSCAKLIDSDPIAYPVARLLEWRERAERAAAERLNKQIHTSPEQPPDGFERIEQNGYYEKELPGFRLRYFLDGDNLHVEQELNDGAIGYYVIDPRGNVLEHKFPYPLEEYSVEVDPNLVIRRNNENLGDGVTRETIAMKWGKLAVVVRDAQQRLIHVHFEKGVRMDHLRKVFVLEAPEFRATARSNSSSSGREEA